MSSEELRKASEQLRAALDGRPRMTIPKITVLEDAPDKKAEKEAAALAIGDLENQAAKNEHTRTERFRDHVAKGVICVPRPANNSAVVIGVEGVNSPDASNRSASQSDGSIFFLAIRYLLSTIKILLWTNRSQLLTLQA